ncbi:[protein-PII] uridylyltransferase [Pseudoteredinibacter isoporae]|uniref:Bifunctional uridylyltransferase/uridylyl-removing enzyme n=1 Tax=Pseudoteredinibacter isoporae TaxID=570281 RepID=A0A7X0MW20_9GAMM|nr:[protein-PII] uridylyltransferase [Pseudoteredinibacter isoporae]MBB6522331.1 [protein-PII] uridylyltransferase [Pseudoteredinibacter isoporae]NHO87864.1 [protein-PII] uridylyltransferase [Pseudoteredinibacter isoporae]NIB23805.1 [protein-PII] uridylyltransferase [Pseudoteredinibacter isoporae]
MSDIDAIPYFEKPILFFEQGAFRKQLQKRNAISVFKEAIAEVNEQFDLRFREGENIRHLIYDRATFIDCLLHYAWHLFSWSEGIALLAVGGYGRGELHPYSDIDILVLTEDDEILNQGPQSNIENIQNFVTLLWDFGLAIGHSVRSIPQCIELAKDDITIATNLMEARTLAGSARLQLLLQAHTSADKIWTAADFFRAKYTEQYERHKKHNHTEYNLEPNIKNAPGGLRDIQTISWVAKRFFGVNNFKQLAGRGLFTDEEYNILLAGEEDLWRVRYALHMLAGRAEERLLFDYQKEIAKLLGYQDDTRLGVENFMRWYYRTVLALREVNDVMLHYLDEVILQAGQHSQPSQINDRFQRVDNYIEVTHDKVFEQTPSALLEIFVLLGLDRSLVGVRASTIRLIREHRHLIDEDFRENPDNQHLFLTLLRSPVGLVTQLRRMKRYGILGLYLPEFGRVTGQMQHDLFHIYTVDAHTLLVIKFMRRFREEGAAERFPIASHVMKRLPKQELLYIAGLYHDIGKGRGGDHSELGAVDAREFCERHGLSKRETRLIAWLVEKHLLMSTVSQKQDISDPDVIHNFALEVGDQTRLDYLYALTVADMNATNPDVWNSWRASLMRQLYIETKRALRRGLENPVDAQELLEETRHNALAKLADKGINEEQAQSFWQDMDDEYFLRESHIDIALQTEAVLKHREQENDEEPLIQISETTTHGYEGATQVFLRVKDQANVFAAAAIAFSQLGLSIVDARIYTDSSGYTIDTFYVLDENGNSLGEDEASKNKILQALKEELALVGEYSDIIKRRTARELKYFAMPTRTSINTDFRSGHTVLEVTSPDRPGFLAIIAEAFTEFGIQLLNAKITTLGERVEDVFFISNADGQPLSDPKLCEDLQATICRRLDRQVQKEAS